MSTYREIHGKAIKSLDTDPTAETDAGQIWYNTTSNTFKSIINLEAWISGAPLTTARQALGGIGTQTANLAVGGYVSAESTLVEEYNGSGWATGGALPAAKNSGGGFGTQTAGVYAGGGLSPNSTATNTSQEYNGTSWTASPGNLNTTRDQTAGAGIETAGLCCGGTPNGSAETNTSEEYNGSTWTAGNNLNFAARNVNNNSLGIQTAALLVGGNSSGATSGVQTYDGTNWTTTTSLPEARISLATSGTQTAGLAFGGNDGSNIENTNLQFDGSSWTAGPTMGTARDGLGGSPSGTSSAAVASGGRQPGPANSSLTEEFTSSANVITAGAWAAGENLNTGRKRGAGGGTQTSALFAGGFTNPPNTRKAEVEEYDGSAWSEVTNMPTQIDFAGYGGTQTAQVTFGGNAGPGIRNGTLEYDGSSWTAGNNMGTARYRIGGAGTQTAALGFGGYLGSPFNPDSGSGTTATEEYDGTNWTSGEAMSNPRNYQRSCSGIQTSAIAMGGGAPYIDNTEKYNGSAWSSSEDYLFGNTGYIASNGPSADDLRVYSKGSFGAQSATYNGTVYTTAPSLATGRHNGGVSASATSSTSTYFGGNLPGSPKNSNATEEFSGETIAVNVKTLTQS